MDACCANPACQSFGFYKSECLLYSVVTSAGMDDILGHSSRQGPWGIHTGGPGYSIAFWEMSRQPSPQCTVKYTRHQGMIRLGNWGLTDDDLIPTDPVCVRNDDWTPPFCRDGKFPQSLAIGIDRCKVACAARPKCKAIGISHPTRGTAAECFLAGEVNDQDNPLMAYGHWDFYDIEEVCEPATESPTVEPTNEPTLEPSLSPTSEPSLKPSSSPTIEPTRDVCTLGTMTAGGIGDRSALLDRKYFKFDDQTAYDDYASAASQYWHNGLARTTYVSQTSLWPEGCMNACCANPACQSFMFYKSECILYSVATSAGMDDILGHSSRQGPWGIHTGGPGYSIAF